MEEALCHTLSAPLAYPFYAYLDRDAKRLLAFQGRRGIISVVRWNLRAVIFGAAGSESDPALKTLSSIIT